jgi:hypothetical protein
MASRSLPCLLLQARCRYIFRKSAIITAEIEELSQSSIFAIYIEAIQYSSLGKRVYFIIISEIGRAKRALGSFTRS